MRPTREEAYCVYPLGDSHLWSKTLERLSSSVAVSQIPQNVPPPAGFTRGNTKVLEISEETATRDVQNNTL